MSTPVQSNLDFQNSSKNINLVEPTNPQDSATKNYVDTTVAAVPGGSPSTNMIVPNEFTALTTSAGNWAIGDILVRFQVVNSTTGVIDSTVWYKSGGVALGIAPIVDVDCEDVDKSTLNAILPIGAKADTSASDDTGAFSIISLLKRLNTKLQLGSQGIASALAVTMARKTTVVGFTTTTTNANTNILDPAGSGAYTDVRDYNSCVIILKLPAGTVNYTLQTSHLSTGAANFSVEWYFSDGILSSGTRTSTSAGFIKIFANLADANYLRLFIDGGSAAGVSATMLLTSAPFVPPRDGVPQAIRKTTIVGTTLTGTNGNNNILDSTGAGAATDVRGLNSGMLITTTNGNPTFFIVEGSNDGNVNGVWLNIDCYEYNNNMYTGFKSADTVLTAIRTYIPLHEFNFVRVRYSTASIPGSTATLIASDAPFSPPRGVNRTVLAPSGFIADVTQSIITATTITPVVTPSKGASYSVFIPVFAVSGTSPTMSVRIDESLDGGSNFRTVYTFPTIVTTGIYISPNLPLCGDTIRYVQTLGGTNPSFNRSVLRVESNATAPMAISPRRFGGFNVVNGGLDLVTQGRIRRIVANNRTATQLYVQIHDSATALVTGAIPLAGEVYQLNTNTTVPIATYGEFGSWLGVNPRVAISSTFGTYTQPPSLAVNTVSLFVEAL